MKVVTVLRSVVSRSDAARPKQEPVSVYPPGQFFREAGTLIAVCLALGLIFQLLLT